MKQNKKIIIVTGASSGIGKDTALALIREGHRVYGAARRVEKMKDIETAGGTVLSLDVTQPEEIREAVERIIKEEGRIDVLVNNAGYAVYGSVEDVSLEDAKRQFDVNLFGLAEVTKEVLPHMRAQKSGLIINMSSVGGKIYTPLGAWYHATKHALEGFSDCLRIEVKRFGIKVVLIEPGAIRTEFTDVLEGPLRARTSGPYLPLVGAMERLQRMSYSNPRGSSPPSVISRRIVRAVRAKRPKRRYMPGAMAKPMVFVRRWLGEGAYEKMVLSLIK